jgi:hypothetical protein
MIEKRERQKPEIMIIYEMIETQNLNILVFTE